MLKDITFGQYFESDSFIHKLDPRSKLLLLILIIVLIFVSQNAFALSVVALFVLFSVYLSKIPLKMYLKNIKAILPIIIFTMIINLFYNASGVVLISFWRLTITTGSLYRALYMSARILLLIISSADRYVLLDLRMPFIH